MEVRIVAGRYSNGLESRVGVPDFHQRFRMVIGQRPEEHVFDDAENGGVRADAQSERQDRDGRESGALAQGPCAEAQVVANLAEPVRLRHRFTP